jgi:hypothetical protein
MLPPTLVSKNTSYFPPLLQGKPNTKIPLENGPKDLRPRVVQNPQKGPNCVFYALNMLRRRIGPNPGSDHIEARRIEKICSNFRKELTQLEDILKIFIPDLIKRFKNLGVAVENKKTFEELISAVQVLALRAKDQRDKKGCLAAAAFFNDFCSQSECDDIYLFLDEKYKRSERKIYELFLKNMDVNPKEFCVQSILEEQILNGSKTPCSKESLSRYLECDDPLKMGNVLHVISMIVCSNVFGFQKSSWTPDRGIDKIQECLELEGPLVVSGRFGESLYRNPPTATDQMEGRPIYTWKAADRFSPEEQAAHALHVVVLIKVDKGGLKGGFVYFVDPNDGSDPNNPLMQKIYKISYENFISHISDVSGSLYVNQKSSLSLFGYAQYYPKKV